MADQEFERIPGKWYVTFIGVVPMPGQQPVERPPSGGPFDTEAEARQWLAGRMNITGANVWQCPEAGGDDDIDLEEMETEAGLAERQERINKLLDKGAVWNNDTQTYSIGDDQFDADGNRL